MTAITPRVQRQLNNLGGGFPPSADFKLGDFVVSLSGVSSSVRDLYVDPVNGNDDNDGLTPSTQLQSIMLATLMFKLPLMQTWSRNQNRTIHVKHTVGMPKITEKITILPHNGEGILIIEAEENILFSGLIENGALSAIAGFENRWRLTLTTNPLTAHALAHGAFVRPRSRSLAENEIDACLEDLPIIDNGVGTLDMGTFDPGIFQAFHYGNGTVVDIVAQQIEWGLDAEPAGSVGALTHTMITNMGSPLIVRGFCTPTANQESSNTCFLSNSGNGVGFYPGQNVVMNRMMAESDAVGAFWQAWTFGDVLIAGGICLLNSIYYLLSYAQVADCYNVDAQGVLTSIKDVNNALVAGVTADGGFGIGGRLSAGLACDVRNGSISIQDHGSAAIVALTVEGAGAAPGLIVGFPAAGDAQAFCSVTINDGTRCSGSAGNTNLGCRIGLQSNLFVASNVPTLAGTAGELQVGAGAIRTWAGVDETDATLLARYDI